MVLLGRWTEDGQPNDLPKHMKFNTLNQILNLLVKKSKIDNPSFISRLKKRHLFPSVIIF